jgi:hypothetical protein
MKEGLGEEEVKRGVRIDKAPRPPKGGASCISMKEGLGEEEVKRGVRIDKAPPPPKGGASCISMKEELAVEGVKRVASCTELKGSQLYKCSGRVF